jgi:hypothetical protein
MGHFSSLGWSKTRPSSFFSGIPSSFFGRQVDGFAVFAEVTDVEPSSR